jgi:SGNH domain (fused to AT3 domains)
MNATSTAVRKPAYRRPGRQVAVMAAVLAIALTACSPSAGTGTPTYRTDWSAPFDPNGAKTSDLAGRQYATTDQVLAAVEAAQHTEVLSDDAAAHLVELSKPHKDGPEICFDEHKVEVKTTDTMLGQCAYGDPKGTKLMALLGDSRGPMWAATLERVAAVTGWQLRVFARGGCPPADLQYQSNTTHTPDPQCATFHAAAVEEIRKLHPQLVVTASNQHTLASGEKPTTDQWRDGLISTFQKLAQPGTRVAVLGPLPSWDNDDARCLAAHTQNVQSCSTERAKAVTPFSDAERAAATAVGGFYVDPVPWVCAEKCEPVISDIVVYYDPYHFTKKYANYLAGAVTDALKPAMT